MLMENMIMMNKDSKRELLNLQTDYLIEEHLNIIDKENQKAYYN